MGFVAAPLIGLGFLVAAVLVSREGERLLSVSWVGGSVGVWERR